MFSLCTQNIEMIFCFLPVPVTICEMKKNLNKDIGGYLKKKKMTEVLGLYILPQIKKYRSFNLNK